MKLQPSVIRKKGEARKGKGFSRSELREAGLDSKLALKLGILIDLRRKTKHEENVKGLKQNLLGLSSQKPKSRKVKIKSGKSDAARTLTNDL